MPTASMACVRTSGACVSQAGVAPAVTRSTVMPGVWTTGATATMAPASASLAGTGSTAHSVRAPL